MKLKKYSILFLILCCSMSFANTQKQLKAFPSAKEGMVRYVIYLPEKSRAEEVNYKVELLVGKTVETDGVNKYRLGSSLKAVSLKGWGYTYYESTGSDMVISTRMAAASGTTPVKKDIFGRPLLIRYNSRLPIVVYVKKGLRVYYRIFEAPTKTTAASEG